MNEMVFMYSIIYVFIVFLIFLLAWLIRGAIIIQGVKGILLDIFSTLAFSFTMTFYSTEETNLNEAGEMLLKIIFGIFLFPIHVIAFIIFFTSFISFIVTFPIFALLDLCFIKKEKHFINRYKYYRQCEKSIRKE